MKDFRPAFLKNTLSKIGILKNKQEETYVPSVRKSCKACRR